MRRGFLLAVTVLAGSIGAKTAAAQSQMALLRTQLDVRGNFTLIGNTLGWDCRASVPAPIVGDVGACGALVDDTGIDVYWRADDPVEGQARADRTITSSQARSTAALTLPNGATVTYARLYWSAPTTATVADDQVTVDRAAVFERVVRADASLVVPTSTPTVFVYQSSADVTALVQQQGLGAYRVSGVESVFTSTTPDQTAFAAWSMVVVYALPGEQNREITVFEALAEASGTERVELSIEGFRVPDQGFDARIGVVAYEGDDAVSGDALALNGRDVSDLRNPGNNLLNGTRSVLGLPVSHEGDLPRLSGEPRSIAGLDIDVIDVTSHIRAGDTSLQAELRSGGDTIFLGALVLAISTPPRSEIRADAGAIDGGGSGDGGTSAGRDAQARDASSDEPISRGCECGANPGAKADLLFAAAVLVVLRGAGRIRRRNTR